MQFQTLHEHIQNARRSIAPTEKINRLHVTFVPGKGAKLVQFTSTLAGANPRELEIPIQLPRKEVAALKELHDNPAVELPDLRKFKETKEMHDLITPIAGKNLVHVKVKQIKNNTFEITHFYFKPVRHQTDTMSIDETMDHIDDSTLDGPNASDESSIEELLGHHETFDGGVNVMHAYTKYIRATGPLLKALQMHAMHLRIKEHRVALSRIGAPFKRSE